MQCRVQFLVFEQYHTVNMLFLNMKTHKSIFVHLYEHFNNIKMILYMLYNNTALSCIMTVNPISQTTIFTLFDIPTHYTCFLNKMAVAFQIAVMQSSGTIQIPIF